MRCAIQVRRSFDIHGQYFVLRVFGEPDWENARLERFINSRALVERLVALGLPRMDPLRCFPEKGGGLDAVWTDVEVPQEMLDGFGRGGGYVLDGGRQVAAWGTPVAGTGL
jgi:hypothetical protein